jgi:hypothetical protein
VKENPTIHPFLESQKMHRYRLSSTVIQFTSSTEPAVNSDYDSDSQPEQRLTTNAEVIRVANLLDQVCFLRYRRTTCS